MRWDDSVNHNDTESAVTTTARPPSDILERITLRMASSLHLDEVLETITQGLVTELNAAFARIWLLSPGDICNTCYRADHCSNRRQCLHLRASAGLSTQTNGEYRRVPLGALKIGRIASGDGPMFTNDVLGDDRLPNKDWMRAHSLRAFAGYPLIFRDELLGVMALFSRQKLTNEAIARLPAFAHHAAISIKNAQLFGEVDRLRKQLQTDNAYLQEEIKRDHNFDEMVSHSAVMQNVLRQIEQVATTDATVLIQGETGTGKELLARAVHRLSPRCDRPLVKVNCAALPSDLVESELFGHEKGAFTSAISRRIGRFEMADGGTLFLDEVGDLPLALQAKLLRVLQEGEFERLGGTRTLHSDVRVIAATNRNLQQAVAEEQFRADLYYRLNVFPIALPPLRERPEDIPLLAQHFVDKHSRKLGKQIQAIASDALRRLMDYPWPGNIRELEHVVERALILSQGPTLTIDEALVAVGSVTDDKGAHVRTEAPVQRQQTLAEFEQDHIMRVLEQTQWVVEGANGAARRLDLNPSTLRGRMRRLGITRQNNPSEPSVS